MKTKRQVKLRFPREPLLIEIERRCSFPDCGGRNQIGLTKSEVIEYRGFDCTQCERWNKIGWANEKYRKPGSVGYNLRNHNALNCGTLS